LHRQNNYVERLSVDDKCCKVLTL